ncbi:YqgE/AlgH family protein [Aliivibrio fischeri]|uniref:YqgE/AlgH family protein n=1 Tax=Aliivibrio fischeri TaxID=668 RepID=UPI002E32DDED|nr:YqgE/AlgH family protein [Aliivibrio fischeri]MCE7578795.1 YqgE/AlgH family protein [Aliivibrio fischeri]MCE7591039.1 YqgE/AlgH family protein [Aliivibrio fischeri]
MNLKNHFLVAMPSMKDPFFQRSVIYICEHDSDGTMGLRINEPVQISLKGMLDQIELDNPSPIIFPQTLSQPVLNGGPVSDDRGFVLHSNKDNYLSSIQVTNELSVTTSKDILATLGTEYQPYKYLVALGYSGWEGGQLEKELSENTWLTLEADPSVIFDTPIPDRWRKALQLLGINPANLSSEIGHA